MLDAEYTLHIARQGTKHLGVMRSAQQVQASLFSVFAGDGQRRQPRMQLLGKASGVKPLMEHGVIGQLINHTGVFEQIARGPLGSAQQPQQALVHLRSF